MIAVRAALGLVAALLVAAAVLAGEPVREPVVGAVCTACHGLSSPVRGHAIPERGPVAPCQTCHKPAANEWPAPNRFSTVLHRAHGRDGAPVECAGCHGAADELRDRDVSLLRRQVASWAGSPHLDAAHARANVSCGGCHGPAMPARGATVDASRCMACHGYYECLADRTAPARHPERNPHSSHLGQPACTSCHNAHRPSRVVCLDCHADFSMTIPPVPAP